MTLQQTSDRVFAKMLANSCFKMGIDKLPFSLSSQQYQYFLEEWKNLQKPEK